MASSEIWPVKSYPLRIFEPWKDSRALLLIKKLSCQIRCDNRGNHVFPSSLYQLVVVAFGSFAWSPKSSIKRIPTSQYWQRGRGVSPYWLNASKMRSSRALDLVQRIWCRPKRRIAWRTKQQVKCVLTHPGMSKRWGFWHQSIPRSMMCSGIFSQCAICISRKRGRTLLSSQKDSELIGQRQILFWFALSLQGFFHEFLLLAASNCPFPFRRQA